MRVFGVGNDTPVGKMYGVSVGCLEGVSDEELAKIPITYVDGMHDRPDVSPEYKLIIWYFFNNARTGR